MAMLKFSLDTLRHFVPDARKNWNVLETPPERLLQREGSSFNGFAGAVRQGLGSERRTL